MPLHQEIPADLALAGQELHQACEAPQDLNEIIRILSEHPAAATVPTYGNMVPVHTACLNQAPTDILEFLLSLNPESIQMMDGEGNLPIHLACFSGASIQAIQFLGKEWPESLSITNNQGQTPIDRARHPFLDSPDHQVVTWLELEQEKQRLKQATKPEALVDLKPPPVSSPLVSSHKAADAQNCSPSPRPALPQPMGVDELRNKLDALRAAKKKDTPSTFLDLPLGMASGHIRDPVPQSQAGRPQQTRGNDINVPDTKAVAGAATQRSHDRTGPGPSTTPNRPDVRSRSPSPAPGNRLHNYNQGNTPTSPKRRPANSRNASPAGTRFPSPARIFGGGWKQTTNGTTSGGRNSSPAPPANRTLRIPGSGGGRQQQQQHQQQQPQRSTDVGLSNPKRSSSDMFPGIPPQSPFATAPYLAPPQRAMSDFTTLSTQSDGAVMSRSSFTTTTSSEASDVPAIPRTRMSLNDQRQEPQPHHQRPFVQDPESNESGDDPRRRGPQRQASITRTFEQPVVMEAGQLTERATRPGAMAVKEPTVRPDAAVYRVAQQQASATRRAASPAPTPNHGARPDPSRSHPVRRHSGITRTFEAPIVVEAGGLTERSTRPVL